MTLSPYNFMLFYHFHFIDTASQQFNQKCMMIFQQYVAVEKCLQIPFWGIEGYWEGGTLIAFFFLISFLRNYYNSS